MRASDAAGCGWVDRPARQHMKHENASPDRAWSRRLPPNETRATAAQRHAGPHPARLPPVIVEVKACVPNALASSRVVHPARARVFGPAGAVDGAGLARTLALLPEHVAAEGCLRRLRLRANLRGDSDSPVDSDGTPTVDARTMSTGLACTADARALLIAGWTSAARGDKAAILAFVARGAAPQLALVQTRRWSARLPGVLIRRAVEHSQVMQRTHAVLRSLRDGDGHFHRGS